MAKNDKEVKIIIIEELRGLYEVSFRLIDVGILKIKKNGKTIKISSKY